jgi:soluble lytic murein transglycosylase-like protein
MKRGLMLCLSLAMSASAWAGAQREEALSDSVRTALTAALTSSLLPVAIPQPVHVSSAQTLQYTQWLARNDQRLQQQLKNRQRTQAAGVIGPVHELDGAQLRRDFLQTVWYESQRAGLEPSLVLGLIQVESGFRKFAISSAGARGFMQVMPFWVQQLAGADASALFQMQVNLRFGCAILRHYLDLETGDLTLALGRYNGSRGQMAYPQAVLAAQTQWR